MSKDSYRLLIEEESHEEYYRSLMTENNLITAPHKLTDFSPIDNGQNSSVESDKPAASGDIDGDGKISLVDVFDLVLLKRKVLSQN